MKVKYMVNNRRQSERDRKFTFGKEYQVIADYRNRTSGQSIADNGLVVKDDRGEHNMLFANEVAIIEDNEPCYTFNYANA